MARACIKYAGKTICGRKVKMPKGARKTRKRRKSRKSRRRRSRR